MKAISRLDPSGFTETHVSVLEWADSAVLNARHALNGAEPMATLWAYRQGNCEHLCCDVFNTDTQAVYGITFVVDGANDLSYTDEPHVPDMADALHMAGMVPDASQARLTIGRRKNEVNPAVLSRA